MEVNDVYKSLERIDILLKYNHIAVSGTRLYTDYRILLSADRSGRDIHNFKEDIASFQRKLEMLLGEVLVEGDYPGWAKTEFSNKCNVLKTRIRQNSLSITLEDLYAALDTELVDDILHIESNENSKCRLFKLEKKILDRVTDSINMQNNQLELLIQELYSKLKQETIFRVKNIFNIDPSLLPAFNNPYTPLSISSNWSFSKAAEHKNKIIKIIKACWMSFREPFYIIGSFSLIAMYFGINGFRNTFASFFTNHTDVLYVLIPVLATYVYYNALEAISGLEKEESKEKESIARDFIGNLKGKTQQIEREMQAHYNNSVRTILEEYEIWKTEIIGNIENLQKTNKALTITKNAIGAWIKKKEEDEIKKKEQVSKAVTF